ncbi:hypothetical protein [Brachyspira sp.]|uniref:hypothetical protein n=1 Tax=Brachyspira sp. TaxID=1977261 RepID=UPI003D7D7CCF
MAFNFLSVSSLSFIKESKSSYFFEWQKSKHAKGGQSSKTISFFVKKRNKAKARFQRKTTPFRIRNSLVKLFLQYSESPSLRVKRSNLNLVKTFLTSIKFTFDSLSRKIKNPCLVINFKFLFQGGYSLCRISKKILPTWL